MPGVGYGMGLERVLLALQDEGLDQPEEPAIAAFVVGLGEQGRAAGRELVRALRGAGVGADIAFEDRPLKAQLRMADRAGAAYAAILGPDEVEAGTVTMRPLSGGDQRQVPLADVVNWLASHGETVEP